MNRINGKSANKKSNANSDARPKKLFARISLTTLRVSCRGVRPPRFQRDFTSFRVECFVLFISSDVILGKLGARPTEPDTTNPASRGIYFPSTSLSDTGSSPSSSQSSMSLAMTPTPAHKDRQRDAVQFRRPALCSYHRMNEASSEPKCETTAPKKSRYHTDVASD